jgi:hypothetical protein
MKQYRTLNEIGDIQAISNRLAQHSRGVDRADDGLLADCYHDDATVDYRFFAGSAKTFAAILTGAQRGQAVTLHRTGQMWIMLEGDEARSESYVIAYAQGPDEAGTPYQRLICGRYLDRHHKRDGDWRLSHRTYVLDTNANWPGATAAPALPPLAAHYPVGAQGSADPGVALLAMAAARNKSVKEGSNRMDAETVDASRADAVISRQEIADLTMAYCRGVDRADEKLLKSVFHDDSTVVSGAFNGNGQVFAVEICRLVLANYDSCFHSIGNQWIEVSGDTAVGETYVIAVSTMDTETGKSDLLTGGRYIDRFERREGKWKFAERTFVSDWNRMESSTRQMKEGMYAPLDLQGSRGSADPVYQFWS